MTSYNEDLLDNYPQHIAAAYARFIDQRDPAAQHNLLLALFEATLKYVAVAAAAQYRALGGADPATQDALAKLGHPSLGHWVALLRSVLAWRRKQELADASFIFPELAALYNKPAADLTAGAELLRRIQNTGTSKISLRQLFDALVEYRNDQAHGAGQGGSYYSGIVAPLQAALEEVLTQIPSLAAHNLLFVESVSLERGGALAASLLRLTSDRPRLRPVRETLAPEEQRPEPQQLYLQASAGKFAGAVSLHPLVAFLPACEVCGEAQVGIINGVTNRAAEYLCYGCGHTNTVADLLADMVAFLPSAPAESVPATAPEAEAEPAAPLIPNNLPAAQTEFVGREQELAAVLKLRQRPAVRLVTLTGPGGTGKTRLALESAAHLLTEFSDGVWLVDLSALNDAGLVVSTLAGVLGLGEIAGAPLIETVKKAIADKQLLFVLDNFEQVVAAAPQIAALLKSSARTQLLVTSRIPLQIYGETEFAVQPLGVPERNPLPALDQLAQAGAVKLFVERARAVRSDFELTEENAAAVAAICARLDGLPLAIELAAARTRLFPAPALLARLDQRLKILTGGARDLPQRQQTMRGAIEWSYDLLSADEQCFFARLAVFQGGARLEDIETVCANQDDSELEPLGFDALEGVELLVSKSLLKQREGVGAEPRFFMLETIREYAREKLQASDEGDKLAQTHAARFVALAEQAATQLTGNDQALWLARLEEEQPNLRAALEYCFGPAGQVVSGLRLAVALYRFWGVRGYLTEGRNWYKQALDASANETVDAALRASALNAAGGLARLQSEYDAARQSCEEALNLYRAANDQRGAAAALRLLAAIAVEQNDLADARRYGEESLAIYRALGDNSGATVVLSDLGMVAHQEGDLAQAAALHKEALVLMRRQGHKRGVAVSLTNLGLIAEEQGDLAQAEAVFAEAHDLFEELGDQVGVAVVRTNQANVRQEQGDHVGAATLHRQNLKLFVEQGSLMRIAESLEGLAGPAASLGQPARAARLLAASAALREALDSPLPGWERARNERYTQAARGQLDDAAWRLAWQEGSAMSQSEAVAYALGEA